MTFAFVLLTYGRPEPVLRLVEALARDCRDRLIVVCHDGSPEALALLAASELVDKALPSPGGRGRFSVIDAAISAMRWLETQSKPYHWLVQLSGQDYPVRPMSELEDELERGSADGYFYYFDAFDAVEAAEGPIAWPRREIENRYEFRYALLKPAVSDLARAILKVPRLILERTHRYRLHTSYGLLVGKRVPTLPFSEAFRLYGGSFWVTINRQCVRSVLDFVDERPDVVDYFRGVIVPEETFFATVLANRSDVELSRRELRFYEFSTGRHGRPTLLGHGDLDRVLASGCYFARKFDLEHDPEIATAIDKRVLGGDAKRIAVASSVTSG